MPDQQRIAVIGAGMAGLTCARALQFGGHDVVVFDKARGPGGRMATRRDEHGNFDLGAQYFIARDASFAAEVEVWREAGVVDVWAPRLLDWPYGKDFGEQHNFVGTPRMSALTRHLSDGLEVRDSTRIARLEPHWRLVDTEDRDCGSFDAVLIAIPAPQAVELVEPVAPDIARIIRAEVNMLPCWAVMATFAEPVAVDFDAASISHMSIDWIAHEASKPGREPGHRWMLHGAAHWSAEHIEAAHEDIVEELLAAMAEVTEGLPEVVRAVAHRWRYARVSTPLGASAMWNDESKLGLCGDWFIGPRVEAAWLSGRALAALV